MLRLFMRGFAELFTVHPRLALFPLAAVATSGFGQTFFISAFGGELRAAFGLSHTAYGALYSGATVLAAWLLFRFGSLADRWELGRAVKLAVLVLAAGCLVIGLAPGPAVLGLGFVLIRFGGQGFIAHLGMTTAARYFAAARGKAVALAAGGIPLAEALLPPAAIFLIARGDWRWPWLAAALVLLLLILPLLRFLSREAPPVATAAQGPGGKVRQFTRTEVLRDRGFYFLLPAVLATPFVATAVLFHQAAIAEERGWALELLAGAFVVFALGHFATLVIAGPLVDRLSAARALPLALLPMAAGQVLLAAFAGSWVPFCYLGLLGISIGLATTAGGTIWADRYGVLHLGAIRSLVHAAIIIATALAPLFAGVILDSRLGVGELALLMAGLGLGGAALAMVAQRFKVQVEP
ncbi:MFS transporter [Desulfurivibrio sp. C05AmB]|uniref:MFS transporter n=1 Tax=Desulfurivibrio sp. C05AmB TaxID=3374371 RepID=UPI00376EC1D8